jgi:RimJ/RimL family protein N-acetyltransferase
VTSCRLAGPDDAPAIARVNVDAWRDAYQLCMPESAWRLDLATQTATWAARLVDPQAITLVAERDRQVVGYVTVGPVRDPAPPPATCEVWAMYASPSVWGQGVGLALWQAAAQLAREQLGATHVVLWVLAANTRGRRFYERVGLAPDGGDKDVILSGAPLRHLRYAGTVLQS